MTCSLVKRSNPMQVVTIAIGLFAAMLLAAAIRADQRRAVVVLRKWFVGDLAPVWRGLMIQDFSCSVFDISAGALIVSAGDHDCQLDGGTLFPDKLLYDATPRHAVHDAIYLKSDDIARAWAGGGWTGELVRAWADDVAACLGKSLALRVRCALRRRLALGLDRVVYFFTGLFGEMAHAWYAGGVFRGIAALRGARFSRYPDGGALSASRDRLSYAIRELEG
jgi:hypothetical protein